jgi:hypothetical protein
LLAPCWKEGGNEEEGNGSNAPLRAGHLPSFKLKQIPCLYTKIAYDLKMENFALKQGENRRQK